MVGMNAIVIGHGWEKEFFVDRVKKNNRYIGFTVIIKESLELTILCRRGPQLCYCRFPINMSAYIM